MSGFLYSATYQFIKVFIRLDDFLTTKTGEQLLMAHTIIMNIQNRTFQCGSNSDFEKSTTEMILLPTSCGRY